MGTTIANLKKLLEEIFNGEPKFKVSADSKTDFMKWEKKINSLFPDRRYQVAYFKKASRHGTQTQFTIKYQNDEIVGYYNYNFDLVSNADGYLVISYYSDIYPITDFSQFTKLISKLDKKFDIIRSRKLKKNKVKNLKKASVESAIKLLSEELNFKYELATHYDHKLKLLVKLDEHYTMELDIQYSKFQEILAGLRTLIESVLDIYKQGLKFKIRYRS